MCSLERGFLESDLPITVCITLSNAKRVAQGDCLELAVAVSLKYLKRGKKVTVVQPFH